MAVKFTKNPAEWSNQQQQYNLLNANGEVVATTNSLPSEYNKDNPVVYRSAAGELFSEPRVSITLDKNTGNIKVSAPKSLYESEAFKQVFKTSDLEALSRAYKMNPAVKIETSEGEMIGVEELVEMLNEDIKKFAKNAANEVVIKNVLSETLGSNFKDLTQGQIVRMGSSGDLQKRDESNALISVPKTVSQMFPAISKLGTFGDDAVKQGDFFENYYNLTKTSGDEIVKLRKVVDAYFKEGNFSDLDEFAKMYALRDFIYTYEPEAGFWQKEGLKWGGALEGSARALASGTAGMISIVQGISDLLVNAMESSTSLLASVFGQEYKAKKPTEVDYDFINTGIEAIFGTENLNEELANQYAERTEYYYALNRNAATAMMLSNLATSVAENIVVGRAIGNLISNFLGSAALARAWNKVDAASKTAEGITYTTLANGSRVISMGRASAPATVFYSSDGALRTWTGWNEVMQAITGTPTPKLWQTLKALSSADTTKMFAGMRGYMSAMSALKGLGDQDYFGKALEGALNIIRTGRGVATGANFIAQVTIDTTLASPVAIRRLISGTATDEDKQIYLREIAWNAAGYGIGILLAKATSSFAKTKVGEAVNAWAAQKMASAKTTFHDMMDKIKTKTWGPDWMDNISNAGKKQVARYNEIINEANRQIANATADLGSTSYAASQTQAVQDARMRAIAVQNAIDNQEAGLKYYMNLYMGGNVKDVTETYYPAMSDALREAIDKETKLNRMLDKLGIETDAKPTALVNGVSSNQGVPQDIVNYIADRYSKDYLLRKQSRDGVLTNDEQKGLDIANERISAFENSRPAELVQFLNQEYYPALKRAYYQINTHRAEAHLESKANREGLIESGLFGKRGQEWIHMQSITEFQKDAVENTNRLSAQLSGFTKINDIPDYFHYTWGVEKDYVHPQLALQNYLWQTAVAENARNSWQDFSPIYKEKTELLVSGEKGEAAQTYQNLKRSLDKVAERGLGSITDDLGVDGAISSVVQDFKNVQAFKKAQKKAVKAQEKALDVATKDLKVTQKDKLAAVMSISDDSIAEILGDESMSNIGLSEESWDKLVKDASRKLKDGIKKLFNEHRQLTGYVEGPKEYIPMYRGQGTGVDDFYFNEPEQKSVFIGDGYFLSTDRDVSSAFLGKGKSGGGMLSPLMDSAKVANYKEVEDVFAKARDYVAKMSQGTKVDIPEELADLYEDAAAGHYEAVAKILGKPVVSYPEAAGDDEYLYYKGVDKTFDASIKEQLALEDGYQRALYDGMEFNDGRTLRQVFEDMPEWKALPRKSRIELIDSLEDRMVDEADTAIDMLKEKYVEVYTPVETSAESSLSWGNYKEAFKFHPEINSEIDRLRVQNDKRYWDNPIVEKTAINQRRAKLMFEAGDAMNETARQLNLPTTNDRMEAILAARKAIDGFKEYVLKDVAAREVIDSIAFSVAPDNLETARDYVTLKVLEKNKKDLEISLIKLFNKEKFSDAFKTMWPRAVEKNKREVIKLVMKELEDELNDSRELLKAAGETIIDEEDVMAEIKKLVSDIDELSGDEMVVSIYNDAGQLELYRTDLVLSNLYNLRPITPPSKAELIFGNSVFRTINRGARFFQTTLNPKSYKNQFFRDFGNAYFGVGSYQAMGMISKDLQTAYGENLAKKLVEDMKETSPSTYDFLKKQAEETGQTMEELVINRYMSFGRITSPAETPTSFYREPFDRGEGFASSLKKTKNKLAEFGNALLEKLEAPNQAREVYLRNATYARGLQEGLDNGMTVRDAQRMAQFFQRNGTTNFGRQLYHFRALQKTVNYFGAGVNGFTSFWRLFSLDPVGVATRIFSGLIVPTIFVTALTLSNEENRKKYIHLPEYYKKEQFVFMLNGQIYRIPIPQELDAFVAPVRQAVESLYESNRNSFGELLLSDFLNIGPIEFGAVMMLDRDRLLYDSPSLLDRAGALGLDLIDQTMPNTVKLGVQTITGIDTYTGDRIDNSYYIIDDDDNRILVGGTTSKFALQVAKTTGASPSIISHVTESLVGQVGEDILDVVFGGEPVSSLLENTVSGLTEFQAANYNLVRSEWNNTVAELWAQKESTYLPAYVQYSEEINKESEPKKIEELKKKRQDAIQPFLDKVKNAVGNLKGTYGGSYDQFRFASVVSLLTFDTGTTSGNTSEARLADKSTFYDNRNNAYLWMTANGLNASSDSSLLGYLTRNADGETVIKYNTPTGILAMRDTLYGAADRDSAEIQILLDGAKIKRSDMFGDDYKAAEAQGKSALKQYKAAWNAKVVKLLAPYIQERGVGSVLNNETTRDLLGNYLFIDNQYQTKQYLTKIFGGD